jgi:rhamnogalacturonan endolyase
MQLKHRWLHRSDSRTEWSLVDADMSESAKVTAPAATSGGGSNTMYGNGNHNMSVADVDGDGKDEIIWGSAALDDDGKLLYATGFGHGDAIHLSTMDPDRGGMQVFEVHEEKGTYSWDLHDAATGAIIHKGGNSGVDNGRGMAADVIPASRGFEFWSSDERAQRSVMTGEIVNAKNTSVNFRMYWNGTVYDQMLDGDKLDYWNGSSWNRVMTFYNYGNSSTCNSTKKTPNLQADIFGDWREELILWDASNSATLNIFTTNIPTEHRVPTLMHDHTYRMAVAWQNTAYNQPPHLGFYLPDFVASQR